MLTHCLDHGHQKNDSCIPKGIMDSDQTMEQSDRPPCTTCLQLTGINLINWEQLEDDPSNWCHAVQGRTIMCGKNKTKIFRSEDNDGSRQSNLRPSFHIYSLSATITEETMIENMAIKSFQRLFTKEVDFNQTGSY